MEGLVEEDIQGEWGLSDDELDALFNAAVADGEMDVDIEGGHGSGSEQVFQKAGGWLNFVKVKVNETNGAEMADESVTSSVAPPTHPTVSKSAQNRPLASNKPAATVKTVAPTVIVSESGPSSKRVNQPQTGSVQKQQVRNAPGTVDKASGKKPLHFPSPIVKKHHHSVSQLRAPAGSATVSSKVTTKSSKDLRSFGCQIDLSADNDKELDGLHLVEDLRKFWPTWHMRVRNNPPPKFEDSNEKVVHWDNRDKSQPFPYSRYDHPLRLSFIHELAANFVKAFPYWAKHEKDIWAYLDFASIADNRWGDWVAFRNCLRAKQMKNTKRGLFGVTGKGNRHQSLFPLDAVRMYVSEAHKQGLDLADRIRVATREKDCQYLCQVTKEEYRVLKANWEAEKERVRVHNEAQPYSRVPPVPPLRVKAPVVSTPESAPLPPAVRNQANQPQSTPSNFSAVSQIRAIHQENLKLNQDLDLLSRIRILETGLLDRLMACKVEMRQLTQQVWIALTTYADGHTAAAVMQRKVPGEPTWRFLCVVDAAKKVVDFDDYKDSQGETYKEPVASTQFAIRASALGILSDVECQEPVVAVFAALVDDALGHIARLPHDYSIHRDGAIKFTQDGARRLVKKTTELYKFA